MKNKQLLSSCSNARHKYRAFLEDQKKEQAKAASAGRRKAVDDEVHRLKKRKKDLETDKESLLTSTDEYAEKAEKQHNINVSHYLHYLHGQYVCDLTVAELQQLVSKLLFYCLQF